MRVRPDTSGFKPEATAKLKKSLAGVSGTVGLGLSDEDAKKKLDAFKARLASLHGAAADITVKDKDATARLAAIALRLARLKGATPKVTLEGFARTEAELAAIDAGLDKVNRKTGAAGVAARGASSGFASLAAAGVAFGPAMLPVLAAATAGALGMGAAMTGAGAALGIFGAAAKGNLTELQKAMTKVQAANKAAAMAEATTASKRTKAQKQAISNAHDLTAAFQKEFGAEANAIEKLKSSWTKFITQPVVTNAIAQGAKLLTDALPHLTPLLKLGALAVNVFTSSLRGFVTGGGLDRMVKNLVAVGKPAIIGFVNVLHNLAVAFGALSGGASKFAGGVISGLVKLSAAFATWATNKGPAALSSLMREVRKLGPKVLTLIKNLAAAVPNLARGLNPLAPVSLALANSLAKIVAKVPPGVITALAGAFIALHGAVKLTMAAGALGGAWKAVARFAGATVAADGSITGMTGAEIIATAATRAWGLAMKALPWVALAAAVVAVAVLIIKHHKQIWAFVQKVWDNILGVIKGVWHWIKGNWPLLLTILTGPIGLAVAFIIKHWDAIRNGISAVLGWIRGHWKLLLGILTGPVGAAVTFILKHWDQITGGAQAVLRFFRGAWQNLTHLLAAPFRAALGVIGGIWKTILGIIHKITGFLSGGGAPPVGPHGVPKGSSPAAAQAYAKSIMGRYGMSAGTQFPALQQLWNNESGWRWNADNPISPAYGIPQADPGSKMAAAGADWRTNYKTQIRWGLGYIRATYRQPTTALALWNSRSPHWYAKGGMITEPVAGIGLRTGRRVMLGENGPERVTPGTGAAGDRELLEAVRAIPERTAALTAAYLADALNSVGRRSAHAAAWSGGSW